MDSILNQFTEGETLLMEEKKPTKTKAKAKEEDPEIEEKREQLSILATLGTAYDYIGVQMSLGDVKKLKPKDVEKYYEQYQTAMNHQIAGTLVDSALGWGVRVLGYVLPLDDEDKLCEDLKKNGQVRQELNNTVGYLILKGGRFMALASGLAQVASHIDINKTKQGRLVEQPPKQGRLVEQPPEHS